MQMHFLCNEPTQERSDELHVTTFSALQWSLAVFLSEKNKFNKTVLVTGSGAGAAAVEVDDDGCLQARLHFLFRLCICLYLCLCFCFFCFGCRFSFSRLTAPTLLLRKLVR